MHLLTSCKDCGLKELSHPPYFPELVSRDFHLFHNLKGHLCEMHFVDDNKLKTVTKEWLQGARQKILSATE